MISNIDKLNLRLVRAFQYLFEFNLNMRHKLNKFNVVLNTLSKFERIDVFKKKDKDIKIFLRRFY